MQPARANFRMLLLFGALLVSACGATSQERTLSGAGIGALVGAGVGVVTDADTGTAAVVGALSGALIGAVTEDDGSVNLRRSIWGR